jgi:DNA-binding response OmpR family regulator
MKKILVIEDNYEVRDNLCEILELSNYEVVSAENGKVGVNKILSETPDLIICDVMMPELDGFGVLKILNKNPKINHIPLIFLTAKAEKSDFRKGMGLGADDYITKPFDDVELLEAIEMRLAKAEKISVNQENNESSIDAFFSQARAQKEFDNLSIDREIRHYKTKDIIFEEGQTAHWLFFVVSGQVKVYNTNDYGKDLIVQVYNEGAFFGYQPLLLETPYKQSAACMEDTTLRLIPKKDFSTLITSNRDFSIQFIKMLTNRAEEAERKLIDMAYNSVRKKVASALVSFASDKKSNRDHSVTISISREDLASSAGTAKETLIRTLSDFKSEGLISIEKGTITLHDLDELNELIG